MVTKLLALYGRYAILLQSRNRDSAGRHGGVLPTGKQSGFLREARKPAGQDLPGRQWIPFAVDLSDFQIDFQVESFGMKQLNLFGLLCV